MPLNLEVRSYSGGGRHRHGFTQVLFPLRGSMHVDIEGSAGVVSSNRLAVIPEQHVHDFVPSRDCNLLVIDVDAAALGSDQIPVVLHASAAPFISMEAWLWRLFTLLGCELASDPRQAQRMGPLALAGLQLIRALPAPLPETETAPACRIREAARKLSEIGEPARVADVARGAGLGQSRFHELFRATQGKSPKQFHLDKLLDRAVGRLIDSREPVSAIAYALGYANASSFNRLFKQRFGVTPTEFRSLGAGAARAGNP
ncbi:MAG: helix-turn-helix domain-containing protein [Hyphomicrobiales bacterium]|nr:helix-turn-helix domain-containing protein [Hyphomicrobiales bacterium]